MDRCGICGDIGVTDALITCTQCKINSEHLYCMRTLLVEPIYDWCCEECVSRSKPKPLASCSVGQSPGMSKLTKSMEVRNGDEQHAQSRQLPNESRKGSANCEKKIATGKRKNISVKEAIMLSSGGKKPFVPSNGTCHSKPPQAKNGVNKSDMIPVNPRTDPSSFSSQQNLVSGPLQQSKPKKAGNIEICRGQLQQSKKLTEMARVNETSSRCSPQYFHSVMERIKAKMGLRHLEALKKTPFYLYIDMPKFSCSFLRLEAILRRFNGSNLSFRFGQDVEVPFISSEFSIVLGLPQVGLSVDITLKMESLTVARLFGGKMKNVTRVLIAQKLEEFVEKYSDDAVQDFCRLYILFVCNCFLFPTSNYWTPRFLLPYVDDLSRVGLYAWGQAAYSFLIKDMRNHLGGFNEKETKKRYFDGCTVGLMAWVYERIPSLGSPRSLYEFPRFYRWGESKLPNKVNAAEEKLRKITRNMVFPLNPVLEEVKLLGPAKKVAVAPLDDVIAFDYALIDAIIVAKDEEIQSLKAKLAELEAKCKVKENVEKEMEEKSEEKAKEVDGEKNTDEQLLEEKVEEEEVEEQSVVDALRVVSSTVTYVQNRADKVPKKKLDFITRPSTTLSKRVKQVVLRGCARGRESNKEQFDPIIVQDNGDDEEVSPRRRKMEGYRGRGDYKGRDLIPDIERMVLDTFICQDNFDITVWEEDGFALGGETLLDLMFGEPLRGDVLDCYMSILCSHHDIWCLSTFVQSEILGRMRERRIKDISDEEFSAFMDEFSLSTLRVLQQISVDVLNQSWNLIIPINDDFHWFLLVLDTQQRCFVHMNSVMSPVYKQTARVVAKFYSQYFRVFLGYDVNDDVEARKCRQQDGTMDCGVYVCLWAECLARGTDEFWTYADSCSIDYVRAHMSYTILTDENGLFP